MWVYVAIQDRASRIVAALALASRRREVKEGAENGVSRKPLENSGTVRQTVNPPSPRTLTNAAAASLSSLPAFTSFMTIDRAANGVEGSL